MSVWEARGSFRVRACNILTETLPSKGDSTFSAPLQQPEYKEMLVKYTLTLLEGGNLTTNLKIKTKEQSNYIYVRQKWTLSEILSWDKEGQRRSLCNMAVNQKNRSIICTPYRTKYMKQTTLTSESRNKEQYKDGGTSIPHMQQCIDHPDRNQ